MREELRAAQEVIGGGGQRVLVGTAIELFAGQLFWCGVGDGAHRESGGGQRADIGETARDPEVGQQNSLLVAGDHDIGRLDVTVQQTAVMRVVKGAGHSGDDLDDLTCGHAVREFVVQQVRRIQAVNVIHRDPQLAVVVAAVVDADDVWVPQRRREIGFAGKPSVILGIRGDIRAKHLECVCSRQPGVLREIHLAHPPRAQQSQDRVPGERLAVSQRHARILQSAANHHGPSR